jgi:V8-like Glu-specific endopeptidase
MKIDLGSVTETGPARFRHTVNTEPGSSGAPVFDAALNLIGIHHAGQSGGPGPALTYNEGIPLGAILTDARAKQVAI